MASAKTSQHVHVGIHKAQTLILAMIYIRDAVAESPPVSKSAQGLKMSSLAIILAISVQYRFYTPISAIGEKWKRLYLVWRGGPPRILLFYSNSNRLAKALFYHRYGSFRNIHDNISTPFPSDQKLQRSRRYPSPGHLLDIGYNVA